MNPDQTATNPARTATRQIDLPRFLRVVSDQDALASQLTEVLDELELDDPLFISGTSQSAAVCADLTTGKRAQVKDNTRAEVARIATLVEHFVRLGGALGKSVEAYNQAVGSLETRVLTSARKFQELGAGSKKEITEIEAVENAPRLPQEGE